MREAPLGERGHPLESPLGKGGQRGVSGTSRQRLGEVVESSSDRFTAQCYRLYESPPLGALIRTDSARTPPFGHSPEPPPLDKEGFRGVGAKGHVYAVVCRVSTQALDPGRPVVARGEGEDTEEGIYSSNPQLARLLSTTFEALIVGHGDEAGVSQRLPALPPRIHAFVYPCATEEMERFTRSLDFLPLLLNSSHAGTGMADEVVTAFLRQASAHLEERDAFLVLTGKALARQLTRDLPRLNSILRRLSP